VGSLSEIKKGLNKDKRIWACDIAQHMNLFALRQAGSAGAAHIATVKKMIKYAFQGWY